MTIFINFCKNLSVKEYWKLVHYSHGYDKNKCLVWHITPIFQHSRSVHFVRFFSCIYFQLMQLHGKLATRVTGRHGHAVWRETIVTQFNYCIWWGKSCPLVLWKQHWHLSTCEFATGKYHHWFSTQMVLNHRTYQEQQKKNEKLSIVDYSQLNFVHDNYWIFFYSEWASLKAFKSSHWWHKPLFLISRNTLTVLMFNFVAAPMKLIQTNIATLACFSNQNWVWPCYVFIRPPH